MSGNGDFERWRRARREAEPPPGFADRVMGALPSARRRGLLERPFVRVAAAVLACAAFAVRVIGVLGLFVAG